MSNKIIATEYWPSQKEYPVSLSKDDWLRFLREIEVPTHRGCMRVLACFIDIGGTASPKTLSDKYKGHPSVYSSSVLNTSKRALNYFGMDPCPDGDTQRYFPIAFLGHVGKDVNAGTYEYKMRPELYEALKELDLSDINLIYKDKGISRMDESEKGMSMSDHNLILYGPPGTGKTYNSVIRAVAICEEKQIKELEKEVYKDVLKRYNELCDAGRIAFTTFHQSYGYEEFIEGIKPKLDRDSDTIGYTIENGVFKEFCNRAKNSNVGDSQDTEPYVFIIDEINRGNISKVFGELITLIEDTKRDGAAEAMEAILPYSGESFSVPNNVYILGTMNTADRSIALMDTALRRRFKFEEMMPDSEVLESLGIGKIIIDDDELNIARMLDIINERIEFLYDREHTIGHAFFTKLAAADNPSIEILADIFKKNVIPLLQEYFYEDYEKIQLILGDNGKDDEFKFILDRTVKVNDIFNGNPAIDLPEKGYTVQHEALLKLESYKQIGRDL